jgi:hypothetical protein
LTPTAPQARGALPGVAAVTAESSPSGAGDISAVAAKCPAGGFRRGLSPVGAGGGAPFTRGATARGGRGHRAAGGIPIAGTRGGPCRADGRSHPGVGGRLILLGQGSGFTGVGGPASSVGDCLFGLPPGG